MYDELKTLARTIGCRAADLLVLAPHNDPFAAGTPGRREKAAWFAGLWEEFSFAPGAHLRRIHYVLISQPEPVRWPDGTPYENTQGDWQALVNSSLTARYLRLIPPAVLVDRRNPEPQIHAHFGSSCDPVVSVETPSLGLAIPMTLPVPELILDDFHRDQGFLVELWVEKSTMNDVLAPLAMIHGVNLVPGIGEMSETAARLAVERAIEAQRPMRILYLSDFDPAGRSMPVGTARKIEFHIRDAGLEDVDIQLQPITLTPEQCTEYRLPRTPIKETERRAVRFEERFGAGATELDALEALHPGELKKIVETEIFRFADPTLDDRIWLAADAIGARLTEIDQEVRARHAEELDVIADELRELGERAEQIEEQAAEVFDAMEEELEDAAPDIDERSVPEPRPPQAFLDPLYDSRRSYIEQVDRYRTWQGR